MGAAAKAASGGITTVQFLLAPGVLNLYSVVTLLPLGLPKVPPLNWWSLTADVLGRAGARWNGIAADPPDSDFAKLTPVAAVPREPARPSDVLDGAADRVADTAATEAALAQALLRSIERYQGADAAGNGEWALVHARAIRHYASLLSQQLQRSKAALQALSDAIASDTRDLDAAAIALEALRARVAGSGLTAEERANLLRLGLTAEQIQSFTEQLADQDFSFSEADFHQQLQALMAAQEQAAEQLDSMAAPLADVLDRLAADPAVADLHPVANPAGPYTTPEGSTLGLDGRPSAPSQGRSIDTYEWDLDQDGAFDDATGPTPEVSVSQPVQGLVGLRVVDSTGQEGIGYALLDVADVNRAPLLTTIDPDASIVAVAVGKSVSFSVAPADPEGDAVGTTWTVDGHKAAEGPAFAYTPGVTDVGVHVVRVESSDQSDRNPLGGSTIREWLVVALPATPDVPDNRAPGAVDDAARTTGGPVEVDVLANDEDPDGDGCRCGWPTRPPAGGRRSWPAAGSGSRPMPAGPGSPASGTGCATVREPKPRPPSPSWERPPRCTAAPGRTGPTSRPGSRSTWSPTGPTGCSSATGRTP